MKKNKILLSKLLFYTIIIVSNKNFAQVNFCRERDSINNSYQPEHLQNFDYKTKDYSDCKTPPPHCGTDEAYRKRVIENPEILENEKRIKEQIKNNNRNEPTVESTLNKREEELKKEYYEKLKSQKLNTPN